uniref:Small ribosomal subunit protein mS23 n=1 Tax=Fagus sylvatica TaxID=28930 RepID=A0A2N9HDE7_FAGSY
MGAPPATFPRADGKVKRISLPEDVYIKKFFQKHPDSKHEDAIKLSGFDPPPARLFGLRVLDLKEQGVSEEEAMAVADMEYRAEKKAKKKAYVRLKQIARLEGKKPPPNPYPSAIKEIQAEERKYVRDRFFNPKILEIVQKLKEERAAEVQDRFRGGGWFCIDEFNGGVGKISKSLPGWPISQDGRHWARIEVGLGGWWVKLGNIMGGGGSSSFDEFWVMNVHIVRNRKDGKYVMAYEGVAAEMGSCIGLAVSSNGLKYLTFTTCKSHQEDFWFPLVPNSCSMSVEAWLLSLYQPHKDLGYFVFLSLKTISHNSKVQQEIRSARYCGVNPC